MPTSRRSSTARSRCGTRSPRATRPGSVRDRSPSLSGCPDGWGIRRFRDGAAHSDPRADQVVRAGPRERRDRPRHRPRRDPCHRRRKRRRQDHARAGHLWPRRAGRRQHRTGWDHGGPCDAGQGRTIIFITHKLREVFALAERVTVMRRGRVITTVPTKGSDPQALASLIVGEQFERPALQEAAERGDAVIDVEGLSVCDDLGSLSLRGATFAIHAGEIVGVAGIEGSGQRELVEALLGLRNPVHGSIRLHGQPVAGTSIWDRRKRGMAFISEDRDGEGACLPATLAENVFPLARYDPDLTRGGRLRISAISAFARTVLTRFHLRGAAPHSPARQLPGGDLQRPVLGREIRKTPRLLLGSHPTRGVDVRGIAFIHEQLTQARSAGAATLLISEELSELIELSDRLLVIFEGRIVADLPAAQATPERLGLLMTGAA